MEGKEKIMFDKLKLRIMRNWCKSMYVIDGDAKEVRELYELMKGLQRRKEPFVRNGFGTTWLGCLLNALGYECYYMANCQGAWFHLEMVGDTLRFTTETISSPRPLAFDFVCKKYPSLACYYRAEEPVTILFETNDREGKYFPEKYRVEVFTPECEFLLRYFIELPEVFEWLGKIFGQPVSSEEQVNGLVAQWVKTSEYAYCYIDRFKVIN